MSNIGSPPAKPGVCTRNYHAYSNRGYVNLKTGNFAEVVQGFTRAIIINPDNDNAYFNRAESLR
jgi:Tfp pilus assembly protein PilF